MTDDCEPTSAAPSPPVLCSRALRQRDSAVFSGTGDHNVEDWLASCERVSTRNKWDYSPKLNANFYLADVANLWFRNQEADINTWYAFKTDFADVFGRPAVRKLRGRAQLPGETFTRFIEDSVNPCSRADSSMPERAEIYRILKGVSDDAFQMLPARKPTTVVDVIAHCQNYDELRKRRLLIRPPLSQVETVAVLTSDSEQPALLTQINQFVREEVPRQLSQAPVRPHAATPLVEPFQHIVA